MYNNKYIVWMNGLVIYLNFVTMWKVVGILFTVCASGSKCLISLVTNKNRDTHIK